MFTLIKIFVRLGYVLNLVAIYFAISDANTVEGYQAFKLVTLTFARIVGIFVAPLGAILGYL